MVIKRHTGLHGSFSMEWVNLLEVCLHTEARDDVGRVGRSWGRFPMACPWRQRGIDETWTHQPIPRPSWSLHHKQLSYLSYLRSFKWLQSFHQWRCTSPTIELHYVSVAVDPGLDPHGKNHDILPLMSNFNCRSGREVPFSMNYKTKSDHVFFL